MEWIAVSGSWRTTDEALAYDVRIAVDEVMARGDGIVTGGALGVDYIATQQALLRNPAADRLRVILPTSLETYAAHYRQRAREGVIASEQAEQLIAQLNGVRAARRASLVEMGHLVVNQEAYYDRNTRVTECARGLLAFQVNASQGVQDTIGKAEAAGLWVVPRRYTIPGD